MSEYYCPVCREVHSEDQNECPEYRHMSNAFGFAVDLLMECKEIIPPVKYFNLKRRIDEFLKS